MLGIHPHKKMQLRSNDATPFAHALSNYEAGNLKGNTIVFNTTSLYNASKQSLVATVIAWIIAITVIAASSGLAQANEAIAANSPKAGSEPTTQSTVTNKTPSEFIINMRDADLRAFIQWIADRTNKNMIVHRSVNGTATVLSLIHI